VQVRLNLAGAGGEADVRIGVADFLDRRADQAIEGFARQVALVVISPETIARSVVTIGLAGDTAGGVGLEAMVKDSVADLVGHLIGMAHRDGFAGKEITVRVHGKALMEKRMAKIVTPQLDGRNYREKASRRNGNDADGGEGGVGGRTKFISFSGSPRERERNEFQASLPSRPRISSSLELRRGIDLRAKVGRTGIHSVPLSR